MPITRPYFGWYTVLIAVVIFTVTTGSTYGIFGLLVIPVSKEFDLSRADMNTAVICLNLGCAIVAPFLGRLLDRVPARGVMLTCSLVYGGSMMALAQSHSLALSAFILLLPLAIGVVGAGSLPVSVLIARWFTRHRGRAMTLAMLGASTGGLTIVPVAAWLIDREGWRTTITILGLTMTVVLIVMALLTRERPGPDDVESGAEPGAAPNLRNQHDAPTEKLAIPAILGKPLFWIVGISAGIGMGVSQAISVSLVPLVVERGFSTMDGASLIAAGGTSAIAGKLIAAAMADRIERTYLLCLMIAAPVIPALGLVHGTGLLAMIALAVVLGFTSSVIPPMFYTLLADRFGIASFGTVRGIAVPVTAVIAAVGVRFIGEMHDAFGNYDLGFQLLSGLTILAALAMLASRSIPVGRGRSETG